MVKITWTTVFQAVIVLLNHSDVIAVPMTPWNAEASAPMVPEVYHNGLTNRKTMNFKQVDREFTSTYTSPPPTQVINRRIPNEAQLHSIKHALTNKQTGQRYRVDTYGNLTEDPKDACDPTHFCGKMKFYDEEGALLHESGCCHLNKSVAGVRNLNSAETLICCSLSPGCLCAAQLCKTACKCPC
ncbi:uncharacterized protein MELLADRAFT_108601 [Melampsora larici-populina 98AG31]|uniref:Secreted protein n=1 Tax=Melampsora larici-populina (strain 98AG31 / pathotype 3-4-7) TaxID=747676 RepID=F4RTM3_MELLP|nr:uncharacterized protein MELLADRAFT_108601 [Melampsora larici-populina 98AG31]EGG04313.1 secreted protein [Melampsora larici-populina 98AG31]